MAKKQVAIKPKGTVWPVVDFQHEKRDVKDNNIIS